MMRWIVGASLRSRGPILVAALAVMVFGVLQLRSAPVDVLPEFGPPTVEIRTEALGLSANEVEQLITAPMEQDLLNGVAFLDHIRSESVPSLSSIELIFEPGTDILDARQVVQERLSSALAALPNVSKPPQMLQPLSSTNRVMMVSLSSRDMSLIDLSVLTRWTIRPRLLGVEGVANVAVWGHRERQLQVQVDPEELRAKNVSLDQVIETTGNALWVSPLSFLEASTPGTGGFIDTPNQRLGIQHLLPIETTEQLAQVPLEGCTAGTSPSRHADAGCPVSPAGSAGSGTVSTGQGPPMQLGDVATVVEDHQPLVGDAVVGDGPGLMLVIEKFPDAGVTDVTNGVEDALEELSPGLAGVDVNTSVFRPATYVETSTDNLRTAFVAGVILLLLALGALLWDWRTAVIGVIATALSLVAAGLVLYLTNSTFNAMVVAGLVLAVVVVVDDATVGAGNVVRRRLHGGADGQGLSAASLVSDAVLAVRRPVAFATLIVLVGLVPIVVLEGEAGEFLSPLAISFALAVVVSMVVALTVTPVLSLLLLSKESSERRPPPLSRVLQRGYGRVLPRLVRSPRPGMLIVGALLVVAAIAVPFLDRDDSLIPTFKDTDLLIHWDAAPGTSLEEMSRITARAGDELRGLPGVRQVGAHVGRAVLSDEVVGSNSSELWISVDPDADHDKTLTSIEEVVDGYPGLDRAVLSYPNKRIREVLASETTDADVTVRVFGQDFEILRQKADEIRGAMSEIDGVVAPRVETQPVEPTLEVKVDLAAAQAASIKPGDVRRAAATLLSGVEVGNLFEEQKVFEVVVWGAPEIRQSLADVENLLIDTLRGGHVRLGDVAELAVMPNPTVIRHESVSRSIDVSADVNGRDVDAVARDIEARLGAVQFPIEHHAELLGDHDLRENERQRFLGVALAVAVGIFLLLQAAFESWRLAIVAFLALPSALVGGVLAMLLDGGTLSIGAVAGFFAVFAIGTRNALVLMEDARRVRPGDLTAFGPETVARAAREHLVPMVTTAVAAILLFVPLVVLGDVAGHEIVRPMAIVIIGGLVTSTLLSVFALPSLYARFGSPGTVEREDGGRVIDLTDVVGTAGHQPDGAVLRSGGPDDPGLAGVSTKGTDGEEADDAAH